MLAYNFSTLHVIFHVINEKISLPTRLLGSVRLLGRSEYLYLLFSQSL